MFALERQPEIRTLPKHRFGRCHNPSADVQGAVPGRRWERWLVPVAPVMEQHHADDRGLI